MRSGQPGNSHLALEATGLSAVLGGHTVLDIPSLQVNPNEVLMIIGPNGSGKTTLLLCLAMLLKPANGTVAYGGIPVTGSNNILQLHRRLAVVLQEPLLLNSSVWDNVMLGLKLRSVKKEEAVVRAKKWLERFGIAHLSRRQARTLSGGEAKRVSLARAFVLQPEVLFLDEPFNALDGPTRQALLEDFESVLRETRVTTVMVTHDRNEALVLADRVAVLMSGTIRQLGTPEEVFGSPVDEDVANFVEAGNIFKGMVSSSDNGLVSVAVKGQLLEAVSKIKAGTVVTGYMHYDDVIIDIPSAEFQSTSARNKLKGRVTRILPLGSQVRITMDCGLNLTSIITRKSFKELELGVGKEVIATFKASSVHLIQQTGSRDACTQPDS